MASFVSTKLTIPIANTAATSWSQQSKTREVISKNKIQMATHKMSTRQVLEDRHLSQNAVRGTSFTNEENRERTSDMVTDKRREASTVDTTYYPSENFKPSLKSLSDYLKKWVQQQKQHAELLVKQVVIAYQIAMTNVVDLMYISSAEHLCFIQGNMAPVNEICDKIRIEVVEGQIPKDFPPGCYIRNGPNPRFGVHQNLDSPLFYGKTLCSWLEGEGMLHAIYFEEDGSIWYKNKYVETESFKLETECGRRMYLPTMDEQSSPGARFNRLFNLITYGQPQRNPGNTSIFEHAGHVVAAVEGGKPFEIDISDLSTKGEYRCNGHWNRRFFGPHPKIHPDSNVMVVYGFDILKPYYIVGVVSGTLWKLIPYDSGYGILRGSSNSQ